MTPNTLQEHIDYANQCRAEWMAAEKANVDDAATEAHRKFIDAQLRLAAYVLRNADRISETASEQ